jgi:uncharacterized membrane protein YidH (DUF202 family)
MADGDDIGRANERTALAWQRTALALLGAALVLARLTYDRIGPVALIFLVIAVPSAVWVLLVSRRRYLDHAASRADARPRGGRSALVVSALMVLLAATELMAILAQ